MSKRREIDKAIAHLMHWAERPEWTDEMNMIFDRNTVDAADSLGMEVNEALDDQIPALDGKTPRQCVKTRNPIRPIEMVASLMILAGC